MSMTPLALAKKCDAYYECPLDESGKRLGPLTGYAGTYDAGDRKKQFVGEIYIDFAKIEQQPDEMYNHVAFPLATMLNSVANETNVVFCGAPMGGVTLASQLAFIKRGKLIYPEKMLVSAATADGRAGSKLEFGRHRVPKGSRAVIIEDVCNNFSTTGNLIDLLVASGATVVGIACFLNRSPDVVDRFEYDGQAYPVVSLWRELIPQYRQDDPYVAADIAVKNVVWQPKLVWDETFVPLMRQANS